ncbi:MAG: hypothetical protein IAX21_10660 [Candidatus Bathyarchaeota archaeon]|nr:hypothetical protein [Candidatus Bathyarchaeum tardum]WGM88665.1 MAG: hypothetical protein NUK63_07010 [Candidatus Bathyarchaeum tardum]WNZ29077.1 MAG: hypothetical protein IAX21_10660 [Candidatus Bathyarchaeota archaeon]
MGKTVESYRLKLDKEVQRWSSFTRALRKNDRETFDQLMDICRNYASASSNATRPVVFEAMVMCILLEQQKTLNGLKKEIGSTKSSS